MRHAVLSASLIALFGVVISVVASPLAAQSSPLPSASVEPFKLATYELDGRDHVGIVLRDEFVVDLEAANRELERNLNYPTVPMPGHMLGLIEQYEYGLRHRIYEIVNHVVGESQLGASGPGYVRRVDDVRISSSPTGETARTGRTSSPW